MLLGGAALTRTYVENDLSDVYEGDVHYARDAFEGLRLMDEIMARKRGEGPDPDSEEAKAAAAKAAERKARHERSKRIAEKRKAAETPVEVPERSDVAADNEIPTPPFWGPGSSRASRSTTICSSSTSVRCSSASGACAAPAAARARRTRSSSRPRAVRGCGTGSTGSRPRTSCSTPQWCTGTSRR